MYRMEKMGEGMAQCGMVYMALYNVKGTSLVTRVGWLVDATV